MSSHRTVLIVDDDAEFLSAAKLVFEEAGYTVLAETDGQKAIDKLNRVPMDAAIVDLNLPEVGGFQLIVAIRKAKKSIPIIAITGVYAKNYLEVAEYLGAQVAMQKPAAGESLVGLVDALKSLRGAATRRAT